MSSAVSKPPSLQWKRDGSHGGCKKNKDLQEQYNARDARESTHMNEELMLAVGEIRSRSHDTRWFIPVLVSGEIPDRPIGAGETLRSLQYVDLGKD